MTLRVNVLNILKKKTIKKEKQMLYRKIDKEAYEAYKKISICSRLHLHFCI